MSMFPRHEILAAFEHYKVARDNWSRLVYGGHGLWQSEEDVYNPSRDAPRVFKAWLAAGGTLEATAQIAMKHR